MAVLRKADYHYGVSDPAGAVDGCLHCGRTSFSYRSERRYHWGHEVASYAGAVFGTYERNGYDDSDFYAVVWDSDAGMMRTICYDTTRAGGGGRVIVDVTDEARVEAKVWASAVAYERLVDYDAAQAKVPQVGRRVEVVRGRKVAKGTTGEVVWYGEGRKYGYSNHVPMRVGIRPDGETETVWTNASNVEVVDPESYQTDDDDLRAQAANADPATVIRVIQLPSGFVLA